MQLNNQEIDQFHELGYVVKQDVFTEADMQPIKEAILTPSFCAALLGV
jgi:hypothetical protein